jgi:hypothetical protein
MLKGSGIQSLSFRELNNLIQTLNFCLFLSDSLVFSTQSELSNGFFFCFNFGFKLIDFIIELKYKPTEVITLFSIQFF